MQNCRFSSSHFFLACFIDEFEKNNVVPEQVERYTPVQGGSWKIEKAVGIRLRYFCWWLGSHDSIYVGRTVLSPTWRNRYCSFCDPMGIKTPTTETAGPIAYSIRHASIGVSNNLYVSTPYKCCKCMYAWYIYDLLFNGVLMLFFSWSFIPIVLPISAFTLIHLSSPRITIHGMPWWHVTPKWSHKSRFRLLFLSTWVVVSNICCIFNPIWGRFLFWLIFFKGFVSPPTSHPWFVSVAWVFFVYPGRPLGIRLLLLAKRKEAENTKLQHISPTIVRSLIYLLAISRIAMEMTISFL